MKALLHYRASEQLCQQIADQMPDWLNLAIADPEDEVSVRNHLGSSEVLLHVLSPADATLMEAAPKLRLIQKIGVGVNTIDLKEAKRRGILVANMPGTNSRAVAEMALALLLCAIRKIPTFDRAVRVGRGWSLPADILDDASEVCGKVVGLVGFGEVPCRLAPILKAMGAEVIFTDRRPIESPNAEFVSFDDLIRCSDIISLHVPLTAETHHMLDASCLKKMKRGVVIINTARGELINEQHLIEGLVSGHVRCAGLDVLDNEPVNPDHPLFTLPNVVLTPHVAWLTPETIERSLSVAIENCRLLKDGMTLLNQVSS